MAPPPHRTAPRLAPPGFRKQMSSANSHTHSEVRSWLVQGKRRKASGSRRTPAHMDPAFPPSLRVQLCEREQGDAMRGTKAQWTGDVSWAYLTLSHQILTWGAGIPTSRPDFLRPFNMSSTQIILKPWKLGMKVGAFMFMFFCLLFSF